MHRGTLKMLSFHVSSETIRATNRTTISGCFEDLDHLGGK